MQNSGATSYLFKFALSRIAILTLTMLRASSEHEILKDTSTKRKNVIARCFHSFTKLTIKFSEINFTWFSNAPVIFSSLINHGTLLTEKIKMLLTLRLCLVVAHEEWHFSNPKILIPT